MKYAFVRAHRKEFPVKRMCQIFQISRSGYYDWHRRESLSRHQTSFCSKRYVRFIWR